jgi:hypothetical protein
VYGEPWHRVREMNGHGPDGDPTHAAVDHYPGETDPEYNRRTGKSHSGCSQQLHVGAKPLH